MLVLVRAPRAALCHGELYHDDERFDGRGSQHTADGKSNNFINKKKKKAQPAHHSWCSLSLLQRKCTPFVMVWIRMALLGPNAWRHSHQGVAPFESRRIGGLAGESVSSLSPACFEISKAQVRPSDSWSFYCLPIKMYNSQVLLQHLVSMCLLPHSL